MKNKGKKMNENIALNEYPSAHYKKFFDKFATLDSSPIENWDTTLVIAYFCRKYEQQYGVKYSFRFNSTAPLKSYEVFQFRKLASMLSSNPIILKDYIDWWYETKIIAKKKRITSMAFLTEANIVNEYKFKKLLMGKSVIVDRSTAIPPNYILIMQKHGFSFKNYGELSFAKKCVDSGNGNEKHKEMLNDLGKAGMDLSILDKVK